MTTRSIPSQVRLAFGPGNRLGSFLALYFGGLVPLTVWWVTHRELDPNQPVWNQPLTVIVLAGLAFSAVKVAKWARVAFGNWVEAVGFVVLMEGTMTYARTEWLSITVLVGLVFINAVSTACSLADEEAQTQTDEPQNDGLNLSSFPSVNEASVKDLNAQFKIMYQDGIQDIMPYKNSKIPLTAGPAPGHPLETPIVLPAMTPEEKEQRVSEILAERSERLINQLQNDTRVRPEVLDSRRNAVEPIPEKVLEAAEVMARTPLLKRTRRPRVRS